MSDDLTRRLQRFSRALLELVSIGPLIMALAGSILCAIAVFGIMARLPLAYLLVLYSIWVISNYSFDVIAHRARGLAEWPVLSLESLYMARRQSGLVFAGLVLGGVVVDHAFVRLGMPIAAELFAATVICILPASAAILSVTGSPLRCINPAALLATVARIGLWYPLMLGALGLVAAIVRWAVRAASFVEFFVAFYSVLLLAFSIGSILYLRRGALGVYAPWSPESLAEREHEDLIKERESALSRAYAFLVRQNVAGAVRQVEEYVESEPDPLAARIWMFQQMLQWEDNRPAVRLANDLIKRLERAGRDHDAAKLGAAIEYLRERGCKRG